jgi:hypothetical protein
MNTGHGVAIRLHVNVLDQNLVIGSSHSLSRASPDPRAITSCCLPFPSSCVFVQPLVLDLGRPRAALRVSKTPLHPKLGRSVRYVSVPIDVHDQAPVAGWWQRGGDGGDKGAHGLTQTTSWWCTSGKW